MNSQVSVEANRTGGQTEFKKSYGNADDDEEVNTSAWQLLPAVCCRCKSTGPKYI